MGIHTRFYRAHTSSLFLFAMDKTLVTAPVYYPISLYEAKKHLRIESDDQDHDAEITALIAAATEEAEQFTRRRLITQTWKAFLDGFPKEDFIILPFGKLQSVTHLKYTDSDGDETTWDSSNYIVNTDSDPGRITLAYGVSWPTVTLNTSNPIEVQFVCGYGAHTPQAVTGASNESPIALTVTGHGLTSGDTVFAFDIGGNTAANGQWKISVSGDNAFTLLGSSGNGTYTASSGYIYKVDVKDPIRHAIKIRLTDLFEERKSDYSGIGLNVTQTKTFERLLWPFRVYHV